MYNNWNRAKHPIRLGVLKLVLAFILVCIFMASTLLYYSKAAHYPEATNEEILSKGNTTIDASNTDQGYIMVKHGPTDKRVKVRISVGKATLTYDLNGEGNYEVFPLQMGDGKYKVEIFQQVSGTKYSPASSFSIKVKLENELLPFLYPSQYIWYTQNSATVAEGIRLCGGLTTDTEKVEAVYNFMMQNFIYDYVRAAQVQKGYLPDIDSVLEEKKGICFDLSAVVACMLRTQDVPVQMAIGYADTMYHAWNNILIGDTWYRYDITSDIVNDSVGSYTIERIY